MKAIVINGFGGPEVLQIQEREIPVISDQQVLIDIKAAGVNRPDVFQRMGKYPAPQGAPVDIPGLEVAGIVVEKGKDVKHINIGDRVMALVAGGGYAEYVNVDSGSCIVLPDSISYAQAAVLPETLYTVWHNLFQRGELKENELALIHGGAGGIGSTAIILAKLFGAQVATTVSNQQKYEFVRDLGADIIINYKEEDFQQILTNSKVDVVLDYIGGEYFEKNMNVLKEDGHLVYINAMHGAKVNLNIMQLMQKRINISGSTLRGRSADFKASLTNQLIKYVLPFIHSGEFRLPVQEKFELRDASRAHILMERGDLLGKLVLINS